MPCTSFTISGSRCRPHRFDDLHVARATAKIARQRLANLTIGRVRVVPKQRLRRHDHSRRAEAALRTEVLVKGLLQLAHAAAGGKALDGLDLRSFAGRGEGDAGKPRVAID